MGSASLEPKGTEKLVNGKQLACSKRSDSGEQCEVKKAMKSRGGLGREVPSLLFFRAPFYFAPLLTI